MRVKVLSSGKHGGWHQTKSGIIWVSKNPKTRKEDEKQRKEKGNPPGVGQVGWALSRLYW